MKNLERGKLAFLGVLCSVLFLAACDDDNSVDSGDDVEPPPPSTTNLRFVHSSYDAPAVDYFLDSIKIKAGVSFGETTGYFGVSPGSHTIRAVLSSNPNTEVLNASFVMEKDKEFTIFSRPPYATARRMTPRYLGDERSTNSGRALVRLVHLSPDAPLINLSTDNGLSSVFSGFTPFGVGTIYRPMADGGQTLSLNTPELNPILASFAESQFEEGKLYTIMVHGTVDDTDEYAFGVRVYVDNGNGDTSFDLEMQ